MNKKNKKDLSLFDDDYGVKWNVWHDLSDDEKSKIMQENGWKFCDNCNSIVIGPANADRNFFVANYMDESDNSFVIVDPHGEYSKMMNYTLKKQGYRIVNINTKSDTDDSNIYNPFYYYDSSNPFVSEVIAKAILENVPFNDDTNPFWDVVSSVVVDEFVKYKCMKCEANGSSDDVFTYDMLKPIVEKHLEGIVYKDKEITDAIISALATLSVYCPNLFAASGEVICGANLFNDKVAVFVGDNGCPINVVISLLVSEYYHKNWEYWDYDQHPITFILDELCNIGKIENLEIKIGCADTNRRNHVSFMLLNNDFSSIVDLYGRNEYRSFISCSQVFAYLGSLDLDLMHTILDMAGKKIKVLKDDKDDSDNAALIETGILSFDDIQNLSSDKMIVILKGDNAFIMDKVNKK